MTGKPSDTEVYKYNNFHNVDGSIGNHNKLILSESRKKLNGHSVEEVLTADIIDIKN